MTLTGKQRSQRISRGYHTLPDPHIARKRIMGIIAIGLGFLVSVWLFTETGKKHVSTGELSQAHYHLNENGCEKCHIPYVPIRSDAIWGSHADIVRQNNNACNGSCHKVADHFASKTKSEVLESESCGRCHQEHLGKERSLLNIADSQCSRCHSNLAKSSTSQPDTLSVVSNFSKEHPKLFYESLPEDPGTVLFSHIQHMRPGQPKTPGDATAKKLEDLQAEYRAQYQSRVDGAGLIQLICSDCHKRDTPIAGLEDLESRNPVSAAKLSVQSSTHQLYEPVDFEKHCVACHALNDLPHGLNRDRTVNALQERLSAISIKDAEKLLNDPSILPSKISELIQDRKDRSSVLEMHVADTCNKCHALAPAESPDLVMPSNVKVRWLDDATFTHGQHLMVGCIECHADAYAQSDSSVDSAIEAKKIMMAGLESCRKCHIQNPEERSQANLSNPHVASADCIDCHRYHVDPPRESREVQQFQGTTLRDTPSEPISARFLRLPSVGLLQ